jgi:5-methylcytosine-specific restriction endonuclease McrA
MPSGIYPRTILMRNNNAKGHFGIKLPKEQVEKIRLLNLGKKRNEFQKQKISLGRLARKNKLGYINSPATRLRMSLSAKKRKRNHLSEYTKQKISNSMKGDKCYNWQGGLSIVSYSIDWTKTLRISIRERDRYICKLCGKKQEDNLHPVHHIDYNKKNCDPKNLITLCRSCHIKTNYNREEWKKLFNNLLCC